MILLSYSLVLLSLKEFLNLHPDYNLKKLYSSERQKEKLQILGPTSGFVTQVISSLYLLLLLFHLLCLPTGKRWLDLDGEDFSKGRAY